MNNFKFLQFFLLLFIFLRLKYQSLEKISYLFKIQIFKYYKIILFFSKPLILIIQLLHNLHMSFEYI